MEKKDILNDVKHLKRDIQLKKQLIATYRTVAEGLQSPQYTDMPKGQNKQRTPMADALHKVFELEIEVQHLEKKLSKLKETLFKVIHQIDNQEYQILLLERYINEKTWKKISNLMGYSRASIFNKHSLALVEFYRSIESLDYNRLS